MESPLSPQTSPQNYVPQQPLNEAKPLINAMGQTHPPIQLEALHGEIAELKALILENQKMTRGIYRRIRLTSLFSTIKWVVIIAFTLGAFYYIQPFFEMMLKTYSGMTGSDINPAGENFSGLMQKGIELFR